MLAMLVSPVLTTPILKKHGHILNPVRYVGTVEVEEDAEVFEGKIKRLTADLSQQLKKSAELEKKIRKNLKGLGYEI